MTRTLKIAFALVMLSSCAVQEGDNLTADAKTSCPHTTVIGGEEVDCAGGTGVCIQTDQGAACAPKCNVQPNNPTTNTPVPLCQEPLFWWGMPLNGSNVCFCFNPAAH